ncbi:hypothetical protein, partial [Acinetobacter baumannii]|uniref:hypothetical protein n=1 Tax=Acinetobacter baumannii TaxID=470 RepID=UPI0039173104
MDGKNRFDDVIKNSGTWGVRAGQMTDEGRYYMTYENVSDDYGSSLKLRQQNRSSSLKQNMDGKNRFDDVIKNSGTWGVRAGQM